MANYKQSWWELIADQIDQHMTRVCFFSLSVEKANSIDSFMPYMKHAIGAERLEWIYARNYGQKLRLGTKFDGASWDIYFYVYLDLVPEEQTEYYLRWHGVDG